MTVASEGGHLLHNLILFGRVLRGLGLDVNPGRMMDLVRALPLVEIGRRSDVYHTARSLLVHRQDDIVLFDQAFEMFWQKPLGDWIHVELAGRRVKRKNQKPLVLPAGLARREEVAPLPGDTETRTVVEVTRTYSDREALRVRDFSELSEEEIHSVRQLIAELVWKLGSRVTRRHRPGRGARLDLRRTLRRNLRYGGELLDWSAREPKTAPRPLVIIADISGSMERYTRLLLHFVYSLSQGLHGSGQRVEAFAFGTRLTRLSRHLRDRDVERALDGVSRAVTDWAGGTRIGESLRLFNFDWARRVLGGGAVVLVISDGWDRGEPDLLSKEIARLQRSCYRLIWLNPLLGSSDYEPLTRGMQAALPHIDDFLPVHNLASLETLAEHLEHLGLDKKRRPVRRGKVSA